MMVNEDFLLTFANKVFGMIILYLWECTAVVVNKNDQ